MKITFNQVTKLFTIVTHYTTGEGAKGIMKDGFKRGKARRRTPIGDRYEFKRPVGTSFFELPDDEIRNNPNYDFNRILDAFHKRDKNGFKEWYRTQFIPNSDPSQSATNTYKRSKLIDALENVSHLDKINNHKDGVHYPLGYNQAAHIANIVHNQSQRDPNTRTPIYRILAETKNDDDLYTPTGLIETRVPESNIDNSSMKLEIPRGMYDGIKRIKREYINDFNDFNESDYNTEDSPTKEALTDIMRKWQFLNKSHGKKRNKVN